MTAGMMPSLTSVKPKVVSSAADRDVAHGRQAGSAAERRAVDAPDHGLAAAIDRAKHVAHRLRIGDVFVVAQIERAAHPVDVGAAAKRLAFAREHHRTDRGVLGDGKKHRAQLANDFGVEGVANVGPGERDARHRAVDGDLDRCHGCGRASAFHPRQPWRRYSEDMKIGERIYRYTIATRASHWLWVIAFAALVSSGLQIFNAAPFLDASDTTNPAHRVLEIGSPADGVGHDDDLRTHLQRRPAGWATPTTGWASRSQRAFPGWITIPAYQDLADGRRWHLFFGWIMLICGLAWVISSAIKGNLRDMILRPSDIPKLWPMQAYYLRLRKEPPPHGDLQSVAEGRVLPAC